MRSVAKILACLAGIFCMTALSSCKTAEFGYRHIDVNGMVYDFSNRPVAGYRVTLGKKETVSDVTGRFSFLNIPVGQYVIAGSKTGYETYDGIIDAFERGQVVYLRIPSERQLLDLADASLSGNNIDAASSFVSRAAHTGFVSEACRFYQAIVFFRKGIPESACVTLDSLIAGGCSDAYVRSFRDSLRSMTCEVAQ